MFGHDVPLDRGPTARFEVAKLADEALATRYFQHVISRICKEEGRRAGNKKNERLFWGSDILIFIRFFKTRFKELVFCPSPSTASRSWTCRDSS